MTVYRLGTWLRRSWRAVAALSVVFALVGAVALTLLAGAHRTITAPDRYSASRGEAFDVAIQQQSGPPATSELASLPAIDRVEASSFVFGGLTGGNSENANTLVFAGELGPHGTRLVDGRVADNRNAGEFVATVGFVDKTGAHLGDHYTLQTLTQDQADSEGFSASSPEGPALDATLVGIVDGPSDLNDDYQVLLFPPSLLEQSNVGVSATIAVASLAAGATIDDLRTQLGSLPDGESFSIDTAPWIANEVRAAVNAQGLGLLALGAVVAITTIAVLGQLVSRQLKLGEAEQSTLSTVGFTRTQVVADALNRAVVVVIVGAVGAAVIAYAASDQFPIDFVQRVEPAPGRRFDDVVHVLGPIVLVLGVLAWMLCSVLLDRARSHSTAGATFVERLAPTVPNPKATTALYFAFGRQTPEGRSSRATLVGLALVFVVMAGALSFGVNLDRLVTEPSRWGDNFDLSIGAGEESISPDVTETLEASADVGALTLYGVTTASAGSTSLSVIGMQVVKGDLLPDTLSGRLPQGDDEIALGSVAADDLDVDVGSELALEGVSGRRVWRVTGITVNPSVGGADRVGQTGMVTAAGFLALDPSGTFNTGGVRIAPGADGAQQRISDLLGQPVGRSDRPSAILNLHRVRSIPFVLAAVVGVLAVISLGHLMIVAVRRRRHDLATLQALGAARRWLSSVVHWQATLITLAVLIVALPIGSIAGSALSRQFMEGVGARPDTTQPAGYLLVTLVVLVIAANVVAAIPARRARRIAPAELLSAE